MSGDLGLLTNLLGALESLLRLPICWLRKNKTGAVCYSTLRIMEGTDGVISCSFVHVTAWVLVVLDLR